MHTGPTTPEQRRLGNYANSFAVQGGVLGGLVGAALGCAVGAAVKGEEGCAYGAVAGIGVGAVAGGVGGNVLKTQTNQAMSEEQRLRAPLTAADQELALARQTEADTRQVVARHRRELRDPGAAGAARAGRHGPDADGTGCRRA